MSNLDITSANSIFTITVTNLLNAPFTLANYATDRAWETTELEQAETQMSIDGYLNAGWVANPVDQTISLSAASDSCILFEGIYAAQQTGRTLYRLNANISLTSTGRKYTMVNGVLRTVNAIPSAGRTLENRAFAVRWQSVVPAGI